MKVGKSSSSNQNPTEKLIRETESMAYWPVLHYSGKKGYLERWAFFFFFFFTEWKKTGGDSENRWVKWEGREISGTF